MSVRFGAYITTNPTFAGSGALRAAPHAWP
jgi:hypothetical protein